MAHSSELPIKHSRRVACRAASDWVRATPLPHLPAHRPSINNLSINLSTQHLLLHTPIYVHLGNDRHAMVCVYQTPHAYWHWVPDRSQNLSPPLDEQSSKIRDCDSSQMCSR
eukprot:5039613-Prymnesium_polylepis.1